MAELADIVEIELTTNCNLGGKGDRKRLRRVLAEGAIRRGVAREVSVTEGKRVWSAPRNKAVAKTGG